MEPYCYSESTEIHLCHVLGFAGGLETRRRAAVWRQDKPLWPEWSSELHEVEKKKNLQNLISLTALAAGFKRVWACRVR